MGQRVTKAEAARQLGLNRSTVCRALAKSEIQVGTDNRFDLEEFVAWRSDNMAHDLRSAAADPAGTEAALADALPLGEISEKPKAGSYGKNAENASQKGGGKARVTVSDAKARAEEANAELRELDLANRLGATVARDKIESAVSNAATLMVQAAEEAVEGAGAKLAAISDPAEAESFVREIFRAALNGMAERLRSAAAA